jgi:hypothetical protein
MPSTAASLQAADFDSSLRVRRSPLGATAMTSVKVPPRSTAKVHGRRSAEHEDEIAKILTHRWLTMIGEPPKYRSTWRP